MVRVAQHKLQRSECFTQILSYLDPDRLLQMQWLSRQFYEKHVPIALPSIPIGSKGFLSFTQMSLMRSLLNRKHQLNLLYVGSEH